MEAEKLKKQKFEAVSKDVGKVVGSVGKGSEGWKILDREGDINRLRYVLRVSEKVFNYLDMGEGLKLSIKSEIPLGSGLGSSSAVTTAVSGAVAFAMREKLEKEEIINLAFQAEKEIQGSASRAGVSVATHGGFLKTKKDDITKLGDLPNTDIVIGYTGNHANTGKLVRKVRKEKEDRPEIYEPIIKAIGQNTRSGIRALRENKLEEVGVLMNGNQNLLEGLRVSTPFLSKLIKDSRDAGALGAKITGAGGGGCMISLVDGKSEGIKEAIKKNSGVPIKTEIGKGGIKY